MSMLKEFDDYVIHFNSWRPRPVDEYNLKQIAKQSKVLFSFGGDDVTGMTFTNDTPCLAPSTTRVDIFYYGEPDVKQWAAHVLLETENLVCSFPNANHAFNLVLHFPLTLSVKAAEELLKAPLGSRVDEQPFAATTAIFMSFPFSTFSMSKM